MKSKHVKRRFTPLEIAIVCILVVVFLLGVYFAAVYYPLTSRASEVNEELDSVEVKIGAARILKEEYDIMKEENERIKAGEDVSEMPQYDNNKQQGILNALFTGILADTKDWNISYGGEPSLTEDGVRIRNVSFTFTVDEESLTAQETVYERTKAILHALMTTGYRCSMSTISLSPASGDLENATSIRVNCSINFYELDS